VVVSGAVERQLVMIKLDNNNKFRYSTIISHLLDLSSVVVFFAKLIRLTLFADARCLPLSFSLCLTL